MKRWAVRICVLLLLGAIVNVAVAWGCALLADVSDIDRREITDADVRRLAANGESAAFDDVAPESQGEKSYSTASMITDTGVTWEFINLHSPELVQPQLSGPVFVPSWDFRCVMSFFSGLPFRSLKSELWAHTPEWHRARGDFDASKAPRTEIVEGGWWVPRDYGTIGFAVIPWHPIWRGFAINTVFYAFILWGLFAAPFALRRLRGGRRIKRGLCPKCAYPVGTNAVCTECGAAVVKQKAETQKAEIA